MAASEACTLRVTGRARGRRLKTVSAEATPARAARVRLRLPRRARHGRLTVTGVTPGGVRETLKLRF